MNNGNRLPPVPISPSQDTILEQLSDVDMSILAVVGSDLSTLWEIMLLDKPVLILASTPAIASIAVMASLALISPVMFLHTASLTRFQFQYGGDFRPFFNIHDTLFKELQGTDSTVQRVFPDVLLIEIRPRGQEWCSVVPTPFCSRRFRIGRASSICNQTHLPHFKAPIVRFSL